MYIADCQGASFLAPVGLCRITSNVGTEQQSFCCCKGYPLKLPLSLESSRRFHDAHAQRGPSPSQLYFLQRQHYEIVSESTIMGVSYIHVVSIMEMYIVQRQPIALVICSWSGFTSPVSVQLKRPVSWGGSACFPVRLDCYLTQVPNLPHASRWGKQLSFCKLFLFHVYIANLLQGSIAEHISC